MSDELPMRITDWEEFYRETSTKELPWYTPLPDGEVIEAIKRYAPPPGRLLELGCGPGTMAKAFSEMGYNVTASDISPTALNSAVKNLGNGSANIEFVVDDIRTSKLTGPFDIINDRGCFHVMRDGDAERYIENALKLLGSEGTIFLKTFSTKQPGVDGPVRYSPKMLEGLFSGNFEVLSSEETIFKSTLPANPFALLTVLKKKPAK